MRGDPGNGREDKPGHTDWLDRIIKRHMRGCFRRPPIRCVARLAFIQWFKPEFLRQKGLHTDRGCVPIQGVVSKQDVVKTVSPGGNRNLSGIGDLSGIFLPVEKGVTAAWPAIIRGYGPQENVRFRRTGGNCR